MGEKLTAKIFDFFITTKCTMNCELCAAAVPYNPNPCHTPKERAFREIKEFFQIWDFAERVEFIGGEPLMHPQILEIVEETLKYRDQFDRLRITTNATIVPKDDLLELARSCGKYFDFIVDDYGEHSKNLRPLIEKLERYAIPYRVDVYHGEDQRYNGWIHFGDYEEYGYSAEEVERVFCRCICPKNAFTCVNDGKAFSCVYALSLFLVKGILPEKGEYIDLLDEAVTLEQKRETGMRFCTKPTKACRYCKGFDSESGQRYPAAKQKQGREVR
ncbi:MAG: radical SAM protein [Christensenellaceae bacterium]|nr:radical SAM protein [Christensenellaceae bacterium]